MTRVFVLGTIVAVGGGAFLGVALALGGALLITLAAGFSLGGALAVALLVPDPEASTDPVILGGPLARRTARKEPEAEGGAATAGAPQESLQESPQESPQESTVPSPAIPTAA